MSFEHSPLAFLYGTRELLWTDIPAKLFDESGEIRDTLDRCEQIIRRRLGWSLETVCS